MLLLLTAAIWGFAFVAQKAGMDHVGPFVFNGLRFALGALSLVPLWWIRRRRSRGIEGPSSRGTVFKAGAVAGSVLFVAASLQQVGIVHTTAGKAGFITGLYVVLVPLLGMRMGHRVGAGGWTAVFAAAAGMYLLSVHDGLRVSPGDGFVLLSAFGWAIHVLWLARWARRVDVLSLALLQFAVCSALSLVTAVIVESFTFRAILDAAIPILYGGVASVGIAYTLQVVAQRDAPPTAAALVLSLEAVFAALGGWIIRGESLSSRAMTGCALMFAGVVLSVLTRKKWGQTPLSTLSGTTPGCNREPFDGG